MEGFCRACLVKFHDSSLLQYSEKNRRLFVYATGVQVKRNDNITFQICKECYSCMKIACTFKKNSRNSDKKLKSYFAIKEDGDSVDLCTYLKNNDDTLKLRLPLMIGNSTPANTKKDDDNESTCTSIQNFMTDILPPEEIPDNEAKIILEVIEEEADILEDSLDSHWLQDEVSIAGDSIQFNFSFSPFATPRLANSDHCYTPRKESDVEKNQNKYTNFKSVEKYLDSYYGVKDTSLQKLLESSLSPLKDLNIDKSTDGDNFEVSKEGGAVCNESLEDIDAFGKHVIEEISDKDSIDKNIENALRKDTENYPLDLILTPTVRGDISAPPTPLISNILFGDKIDDHDDTNNKQKVNNDIIDEFLNNNSKEEIRDYFTSYDIENETIAAVNDTIEDIKDVKVNILAEESRIVAEVMKSGKKVINIAKDIDNNKENKKCDIQNFNITNFYCKMCNKQFKNLKGLKIHSMKHHGTKILYTKPGKHAKRREMICDYCGKLFVSPRCIIKHLQRHTEPTFYACKYCPLNKFTSKHSLERHNSTHIGIKLQKELDKILLLLCEHTLDQPRHYIRFDKPQVLAKEHRYRPRMIREAIEIKKHPNFNRDNCWVLPSSWDPVINKIKPRQKPPRLQDTKYVCKTCGKGFASSSNFRLHERRHARAHTHHCGECGAGFVRASDLAAHMRRHTGEKPHHCTICLQRFTRSDSLNRHIKRHTGEKPFECEVCQKKFVVAFRYKTHLKQCIQNMHREA